VSDNRFRHQSWPYLLGRTRLCDIYTVLPLHRPAKNRAGADS